MTNGQTISWIFLSIAMASQKTPANVKEISMIANGINHAVPTQREFKLAITWLLNQGQIKQR